MTPMPLVRPVTGNVSTLAQVAPVSALFHRPSLRDPMNRTLPKLGSTARRSPAERPSSLPPILKGMSVRWKVRPPFAVRTIAPLLLPPFV